MAVGRYTVTVVDFNGASSTTSFEGDIINASNYADQLLLQLNLQDAFMAIIDGQIKATSVGATYNNFENVRKSDDPEAQRNNAWRVAYQDTVTGAIETFLIRTANQELAVNQFANGQMMSVLPLDSGAGQDFKVAFDAYQLSKAGNPVELLTMQLVS